MCILKMLTISSKATHVWVMIKLWQCGNSLVTDMLEICICVYILLSWGKKLESTHCPLKWSTFSLHFVFTLVSHK